MVEIGKLTASVESLLKHSEKHETKLDDLSHKVSFVKGATWVIGGLLSIIVLAIGYYFAGKLNITISK